MHTISQINQFFGVALSHLQEWIDGSGVAESIARLAIESLTAKEMNERIQPKHPIKTGGWWCRGVNFQTGLPMGNHYGQGKPDKPHELEPGKMAKYLTSSGMQPDAIFLGTPDRDYWAKVYANQETPRFWTEGVKKAGSGLSIGLATIALTGVWNWGKDNQLAPNVEKWAQAGTTHYICFDSDYHGKRSCRQAIIRFSKLLKAKGCKVFIVCWGEEFKGMDDYIVANGGDAFNEQVANAVSVSQWEKQFKESKDDSKPPKPAAIAAQLAEDYARKLKWHDKENAWYRYEAETPGVWSEESDVAVGAVILAELKARLGLNFGADYLSSVMRLLKHELVEKVWNERKDLIPLIDGVLNKKTLELTPHSPTHNLTWGLPIKWSERSIGCDPIKSWMLEIMKGDSILVELLRAVLNCVVVGRPNYQRYLEAIGPGGTGKGTFFRLASALVGDKNVFPTTLKNLEENRFELAAAAKSKLILISEAEKYGGEVNILKALTGQDKTRIEVKGRQQKCGDGFTFEGTILLSANEAVQNADYTSGLERRRLSIPFNHQTSEENRRDLADEFEPYLAGLLHWVLAMPEAEVRNFVLNTKHSVPSLAKAKAEALVDTNPLADWLDSKVVLNPSFKTYVGVDSQEKVSSWLYANYVNHSKSINSRALSQRRFSNLLEDLCNNQLKLEGIKRGRDRYGSYFEGLKLRDEFDKSPPLITGVVCDGSVMSCDESVTAETLTNNGCDGCDVLLPNQALKSENFEQQFFTEDDKGQNQPQPVTPIETHIEKDSDSSHDPSQERSQPITAPTETFPCVGAKVGKVNEDGRRLNGWVGYIRELNVDKGWARVWWTNDYVMNRNGKVIKPLQEKLMLVPLNYLVAHLAQS